VFVEAATPNDPYEPFCSTAFDPLTHVHSPDAVTGELVPEVDPIEPIPPHPEAKITPNETSAIAILLHQLAIDSSFWKHNLSEMKTNDLS
jgi:hypothetical protein